MAAPAETMASASQVANPVHSIAVVMAKAIALKTIGAIGHAGATYKAVEFTGCAIDALSLDQR